MLAALNHPHIAQIFGLERVPARDGETVGLTALVMELVEGDDLSQRLARLASPQARGGGAPRGLPIEDALPMARQMAEALEAAHEQGIVHRDLDRDVTLQLRIGGPIHFTHAAATQQFRQLEDA